MTDIHHPKPPPLGLCYHGVDVVALDDDPHRLFMSPEDLRRQVLALEKWGYEFLTVSRWAKRVLDGDGAGCVALTFDDGFANNLEVLVPILSELGVTATVFVVAGWLGQLHPDVPRARILDSNEVAELHASGVEVGAQTMTHPDLADLEPERALAEMRDSRLALEEIVGASVTSFAYPYGSATPATRHGARAAGFAVACRALGQGNWGDPFDLPRQDMGNRASLTGLRLKRDDRYIPMMRFRAARAGRRARLAALGVLAQDVTDRGTSGNISARVSTTTASIVSYDPAEGRAALGHETFRLQHELANHPLFELDSLVELADQLPPDVVEHNLGSVDAVTPGGEVPRLDLTPGEIVRGIESNGCWMVLPFVHEIAPWDAVLAQIFDELGPLVPGGRAGMEVLHSVVILAAPGSTTPSHVDPEFGFLLHIRGEKRLSIGRFPDGTEQAELDRYYAGGHRNTSELPVDVQHVDLLPGDAVHVPPHKPHWVTNGQGVTVALSVGFQTQDNRARMRTHRFNGSVVRRVGLTPRPVGSAPGRDRLKAGAANAIGGLARIGRRSR